MTTLSSHLTRCFLAGIVALLPIGGTILLIAYLESSVAGSWLARQPYYFPGAGLLLAAVAIYGVGLIATTVLGRWAWSMVDRLLDRLPVLGRLYQTLKQILGVSEGKDAIFQQVVLVPSRDTNAMEIGLVTHETVDASDKKQRVVFVPSAPTPTTGRLLIVDETLLVPLNIPASEALKALVSLGKVSLPASTRSLT
jgi:uncharacterized membrane protein